MYFWKNGIKQKIEISVIRSIHEKINSQMPLAELHISIMDAAKEPINSDLALSMEKPFFSC